MLDDAIDRLRQMIGPIGSDMLLLVGPLGLLAALLLLGVAGNSQSKRWLGRLGWLLLIMSIGTLMYAISLGQRQAS